MPSKLKVDAALSVTDVVSDAPFARFCQVMLMASEVAWVRCTANCNRYCPPLVKPGKLLVFPGPVAREVQSPLEPSNEESLAVVRFTMLMGEALLNVTAMF